MFLYHNKDKYIVTKKGRKYLYIKKWHEDYSNGYGQEIKLEPYDSGRYKESTNRSYSSLFYTEERHNEKTLLFQYELLIRKLTGVGLPVNHPPITEETIQVLNHLIDVVNQLKK